MKQVGAALGSWTTGLIALGVCASAMAQSRAEPLPKELEQVEITEHLGERVPLGLTFLDEDGRVVRLGDVVGKKPTILTLNYSDCPMLCSLQLDGLVAGMRELEFGLGVEYQVVTVSINPNETPQRAQQTKEKYLKSFGREHNGGLGWRFLTGNQEAIDALTKAVGFGYRFIPDQKEFAHGAVAMLVSPEGVLTRYLYGVVFEARTLRLSIVEASEGRVGSVVDHALLFCFKYDATKGRYAPVAMNVMRLGGALTVLILGGMLWSARWSQAQKKLTRTDKSEI